ncbi:amino acid ABC transporter permease [endosymbiont of unidentified scaly snail isolate Monju]|uniref:amino acid ABC transporter permease n=1 Tax=endosymbiont of unidentified scaly snail isolate Monju TaxID=1248727 RepID=UPI000389267D|nr:amino acid ABC transporter permease [endosymbiont of unidentified scaly snail isolate Monju]BAN69410.1 general L-amino acid ABC transporter permease [endosymbiont of unidentified scaly snail isolate Monju]
MSDASTEKAPAAASFWRDPEKRAWLFQILVVAVVLALFGYIFQNTLHNLEKRGISTGFAFLNNEAGFGVLMSLIPYDETYTFGRTFLVGLLNTLLVSVIGIVFATLFGFIIGVARLSSNWIISRLAALYIEIFRNIPLLLQILFWYFAILPLLPHPRQSIALGEAVFLNKRGMCLPAPLTEPGFGWVVAALGLAIVASVFIARWARHRQEATGQTFPVFWTSLGLIVFLPWLAFGITGFPLSWEYPALRGFNFRGGITVIPELFALALALSIYTAAYIAEIVRSGIQSVSHGQTEAAHALGLKPGQTLRLVIIPQAMRVIIPQLTSQYLNLTKNSSLAPAIGYPDLVALFAGTTLNQTGQAVEIIGITMGVYLTISLSISAFMNWYNKRMALVER